MVKPPASTIPGMTDTLDFVKNLWGSMHIPGANMPGMSALAGPPLSVDDLDKRIADLKAVESWLNLNVTMLRGSIQALEVQRGTLVTLRTMGSSMAEAMRQSGVSAEKMANTPFAAFFSQPAPAPAAKPAAPPPPASPPAPDAAVDPASAAAALGMPAAMAWWNMLQDQFTQAVTTAITPVAGADGGAHADAKADAAPGDAAPNPADNAANGVNGRQRNGKPKADKA